MARVTIEDCLTNVENMYELVHLATKRCRQLHKGAEPLVKARNREVVMALREIAQGCVAVSDRHNYKNPQNNLLSGKDELLPFSN
jgi:DNA-directed RNA polymerase subunit omega